MKICPRIVALLCLLSPWLPDIQSADNTIPPPAGYKTPSDVIAAIASGEIKLLKAPKEMPLGVIEQKNLEYGKVGERALLLDLYAPEKISKPVPGLIFIHGGGWTGGSRDVYKPYTVHYSQNGYVAVTISYRFSGEAPFPAAVEDAKCAVRWLRANAASYRVDPDHIAVIGGSAGGHLSLMVGYSSDVPELEGNGGNPNVSSRAQAVVDFYGPYDLTTDFARKAGVVKKFLENKTYDEAPRLYLRCSPLNYLTKDDPPTLIFHGTIDDVVPIEQSDRLAARLKALGIPVVYDRLEGWPHAMDAAEIVHQHCQKFMDQFFAKYLPLPK